MKIQKLPFFSFIIFITLLSSCSNSSETAHNLTDPNSKYGGVLKINELASFKNLYPLSITESTSHRIGTQVYEGLVKFSQKDLTLQPALATNWLINDDATEFTFTLRKKVKFHDDACFEDGIGRTVTIEDVKFTFDNLCSYDAYNSGFSFVQDRIVGAKEYYEAGRNGLKTENGVMGVQILNDSTLQIKLNYSFAGFLNILATPFCWMFPKEAKDTYGVEMRSHCVGTGPFKVKYISEGDAVVLEKNKTYWATDSSGKKLPYLDGIEISFIKERESEYFEFKKGNLDFILKPSEKHRDEYKNDAGTDFVLQEIPNFAIEYYGLLNNDPIFKNKKIRQAFNYAIDREKINKYILKSTRYPAVNGIVPPAFKNYPKIKGYNYNPKKAKKLLAEAGFANGVNFKPVTLQLNSGGSANSEIAEVIKQMLEDNLNIEVNLNILPWAEHLKAVESGNAHFFRSGWIADYPDPENFLTLLYGKLVPKNENERSYQNSVRYKNDKFDELYEQALKEVNVKKRQHFYAKAEQVAMNDAPLIPLMYGKNIRLVKRYVHGLDINPMEYRDYTQVYLTSKN